MKFAKIAQKLALWTGSPKTFIGAIILIFLRGLSGRHWVARVIERSNDWLAMPWPSAGDVAAWATSLQRTP